VAVILGAVATVGYHPWPLEIAMYGLFIGGTAAAVSGKPLFRAISGSR
jgi:hypothetical protein